MSKRKKGMPSKRASWLAPPWMATGAVVANVNYDLCPAISLDEMVEETARAVRFCHAQASDWGADGNALYLVGHSAGAHLSAEMLLRDWRDDPAGNAIRGVAALTGIYEPEIVLGVTVNEEAQVTAEVAKRRNCLNRPLHLQPEVVVAVGGDEPEGWRGQSAAFAQRCREAGLATTQLEVPGGDHFTALEAALEPGDPLHAAVTGLWQR